MIPTKVLAFGLEDLREKGKPKSALKIEIYLGLEYLEEIPSAKKERVRRTTAIDRRGSKN